jgi:hypothetical protein
MWRAHCVERAERQLAVVHVSILRQSYSTPHADSDERAVNSPHRVNALRSSTSGPPLECGTSVNSSQRVHGAAQGWRKLGSSLPSHISELVATR